MSSAASLRSARSAINLITERKKNKKNCDLESLITDATSEKNLVREDVITTLEKLTEKEVIECKYYAKA